MTTSTNIISRVRTALKNRKKNPDWARVDQPDGLIKGSEFAVYGLVITAFIVLITLAVMIGDPIEWIAIFLASLNSDLPFNQLLASFAAAVIVLINMLITVIFIMFTPATNDDVIEMISDSDKNIQERFVEMENSFNERLDAIKRNE